MKYQAAIITSCGVLLACSAACHRTVDWLTFDKIAVKGLRIDDLGQACALGEALHHALLGAVRKRPEKALAVANVTAGLCAEVRAWEAELAASSWARSGAAGAAAMSQDQRLAFERHSAVAAGRFLRAFRSIEACLGTMGGECPRMGPDDQLLYALGLVVGMLSAMRDKASGSRVGVPLDILRKVARGSTCLADGQWWHLGQAIRGSVWTMVPGSGPEGRKGLDVLERAGHAGATSGVRVAWGIHNLIAGTLGRQGMLVKGLKQHAASILATPADGRWRLLDEYARQVSLHEADLLWIKHTGHRAPKLGALPPGLDKGAAPTVEDDLFSDGATE